MKNKKPLMILIVSILSMTVLLAACSPAAAVEVPQAQVVAAQPEFVATAEQPKVAAQEAAVVIETQAEEQVEVETEPVENEACPICGMDLSRYNGPLTAEEVEGLLLALNDEYHAWAVYDQVLQDHGDVKPFSNIIGSEATHIDQLIALFDTYGVPVPQNPWIGNVPSFASTSDACHVGVEAEILNVELYGRIDTSTEREDILTVYDALQRASNEKHLPAFERCAR